jgi:hypothetical protein
MVIAIDKVISLGLDYGDVIVRDGGVNLNLAGKLSGR